MMKHQPILSTGPLFCKRWEARHLRCKQSLSMSTVFTPPVEHLPQFGMTGRSFLGAIPEVEAIAATSANIWILKVSPVTPIQIINDDNPKHRGALGYRRIFNCQLYKSEKRGLHVGWELILVEERVGEGMWRLKTSSGSRGTYPPNLPVTWRPFHKMINYCLRVVPQHAVVCFHLFFNCTGDAESCELRQKDLGTIDNCASCGFHVCRPRMRLHMQMRCPSMLIVEKPD